MLRIGILGTGRIVETAYVPAFRAIGDAKLTAVLGIDAASARQFAAKHGIPSAYDDIDGLLGDPQVDAVIVATPDATHESQVIAAARAGKHILCEKPMTTTVAGCERMAEAVRQGGVTFAIGYSNRFNTGLRRIKQLIDAGAIGTIRYARALSTTRQTDPTAWRAQPEQARYWALSANGAHLIDVFRWYFGEPARVGGGMLSPVHGSVNDEISSLVFDYPNRLLAELTVAAILPAGNRIELHGEDGAIIGVDVFGPRARQQVISCRDQPVEVAWSNPFVAEIADFIESVTTGRPPNTGLEDGLRGLLIMETARTNTLLVPIPTT